MDRTSLVILMVLIFVFGCQDGKVETSSVETNPCLAWKPTRLQGPPPPIPDASYEEHSLYVLGSDYQQAGELRRLNLESARWDALQAPIHSDAGIRVPTGPYVYVLNRLGADNIQVIRKSNGETIHQFSVGRGCNPMDLVVVGNSLVISRHSAKELIAMTADGRLIRSLDLSTYADEDSIPEMAGLIFDGRKILLQIQALNRDLHFTPTGRSRLLVIDPETFSVEQEIFPQLQNPVGRLVSDGRGFLFQLFPGELGRADGGLGKFDGVSYEDRGVVFGEASLGGEPLEFVHTQGGRGALLLFMPTGGMKLVGLDLETAKVGATLWKSDRFDLSSLVWDAKRALLMFGDRTQAAVLAISESGTLVSQWSMELPPAGLEISP